MHSANLTKDLNKNIANIEYNILNLPSKVTFGGGNSVAYMYAANGKKVQTVHSINGTITTTDYIGNMIYENGTLKRPLVDGEYYENDKYYFYIQDHLGNNRVVADGDGNVIQMNDCYPFGVEFASNTNRTVQPYKYNGKELDTKGGLNLYHYGVRHYDPVLGRFIMIDPMAEKYYSISPYLLALAGKSNIENKAAPLEGKIVRRVSKGKYSIEVIPTMRKGHVATTHSKVDTKNIIIFASKTSNVEWSLSYYKNGKSAVGTLHQNSQAPQFSVLGEDYKLENQIYDVHSHTGTNPKVDFIPSTPDINFARSLIKASPNAKVYIYAP